MKELITVQEEATALVSSMTAAELREAAAALADGMKKAKALAAAINAEVKVRIKSGKCVPGFSIDVRAGAKSVLDLNALAQEMADELGITKDEFIACCKFEHGKASKLYAAKMKEAGLATKKAATERFKEVYDESPNVVAGPTKEQLVRV